MEVRIYQCFLESILIIWPEFVWHCIAFLCIIFLYILTILNCPYMWTVLNFPKLKKCYCKVIHVIWGLLYLFLNYLKLIGTTCFSALCFDSCWVGIFIIKYWSKFGLIYYNCILVGHDIMYIHVTKARVLNILVFYNITKV